MTNLPVLSMNPRSVWLGVWFAGEEGAGVEIIDSSGWHPETNKPADKDKRQDELLTMKFSKYFILCICIFYVRQSPQTDLWAEKRRTAF